MHWFVTALGPITAMRADGARIEREDGRPVDRLVAQQHGASDGGTPGQRPLGRIVDRLLDGRGVPLVRVHPVHHQQQVEHEPVDLGLGDLAGVDRGDELVAVHAHGSGHLEVEPRVGRLGRVVHAEPVGHDEAVEAPLAAQDVGEESLVLGAVLTAEPVVGAHDPPCTAFGHGPLERPEVDLAEGTVVDLDVDRHAVHLGVVAGEVLHRDGHVLRLHPPDVGRGEHAGQFGILAVALERPPADRRAVDVDGRSEQDVGALALRLRAEQLADPLQQVRVPRRPQRDPRRHHHARRARSAVALAAHAVGSVGHLHLGDAGVGERLRAPGGLAGEQPALVLERESGERSIGVDHAPNPASFHVCVALWNPLPWRNRDANVE